MSYYYKYSFVSPEPIYALVKEELKSYFDTGAVDDLLFPLWTSHCLKKLGRATYPILPSILFIDDFQAKLPPDFLAVREAWLCADTLPQTAKVPGTYYTQITTRLNDPLSLDSCSPCDPCNPNEISIVYKTNTYQTYTTKVKYLLKPGNLSVMKDNTLECINETSTSNDTFDIVGNKMMVSFREATVYLSYYAKEFDDNGYQLIPDNFRIQKYIELYIKYKVYEMLSNQITDETANQIEKKFERAKVESDEAFIMAEIEKRKKTLEQRVMAIHRDRSRNRKFEIR